jgi:uncharacterized membrane protein YcaP (DUF421 family)
MDTVIRACFVYFLLLLIFRIAGKRTLGEITTFDFVLTLIISEAIQQALVDSDHSMTNAFLLVVTLVGLNVLMSLIKQRSRPVERLIEDTPVIILEKDKLHRDRMDQERVDDADILAAARELQGISRLDQIQYAVVEKDGKITCRAQARGAGRGGLKVRCWG